MNYKILKIRKQDLNLFIQNLKNSYRLMGPAIENEVIMLREIGPDDLPSGFRDSQSPGHYRLVDKRDDRIFTFSNGPDSFKRFIFSPVKDVFEFRKTKRGLIIKTPHEDRVPLSIFGVRACDIEAIKILNRVFSNNEKKAFIVGLNCIYPGENCFCASLGSGPEIRDGCDMVITELERHLLIESGEEGLRFLQGIFNEEASEEDLEEKESIIEQCRNMIKKSITTGDLPARIYRNSEHPLWSRIAERCLACGNCTQVCPTCFCNSSFDLIDMPSLKRSSEGVSGKRVRIWDSCFSMNFARVHGGNFRPSRRARYRQWLSHKFGYWIDQFGIIGCVGCGRCITWCPVGIDITEELGVIR